MDLTPLGHAIVAVCWQVIVGVIIGDWWVGGLLGCMWFMAREHTQAEYRWIAQYGAGKRANLPWWGGFDPRAWSVPSLLDWLVPVLCVMAVGVI